MRFVEAIVRPVTWRMAGTGAARGRTTRSALLVELRTDTGIVGLGEAAPLPGSSPDTLADAARDLATFAARLPSTDADALAIASPAARFAIETAMLDARARGEGVTIAELLGQARADVPLAYVVDTPAEAIAAVARGAACLKIKVGHGDDRERIAAIASAAPGVPLRLDANRSWPRDSVIARLAALRDLPIEFVEEPCSETHELLGERLPIPLALDESLATLAPDALARALASPGLAALILKPTLLGGLRACIDLAGLAARAGVHAIVTHALEGPIGTAACLQLARALGTDRAAGLAPHPALAAWSPAGAHDLAELVATLDDPLSRTPRVAVDRSAVAIVATPTPATLGAIYAALDAARPIALVHAALPPAEQARQRVAVEQADLPVDAAVVLFTSGSTGSARGVVLARAALLAAADAGEQVLGWQADDSWLAALSLAHAGGLAVVIRCLAARKPVVLLGEEPLADALARVTLASLVPTQLAQLLAEPSWRPPPRLRAILLGGAAASPALLAAAAERGVPFLCTYGMTESFGQLATARRIGDPRAPLVPLPGVELAGGSAIAPAPICVRAPMLATCYLDGAPIAPAHTTSDLGHVDADGLHVVGRADDVIITGGENVHPAAVEAVLAATPGVRAVCAFAVPDARWGHIVGAAIAGPPPDTATLARWHAALPPSARPRELAIVGELPVLPNGKLDRRAAARLPRSPVRYA